MCRIPLIVTAAVLMAAGPVLADGARGRDRDPYGGYRGSRQVERSERLYLGDPQPRASHAEPRMRHREYYNSPTQVPATQRLQTRRQVVNDRLPQRRSLSDSLIAERRGAATQRAIVTRDRTVSVGDTSGARIVRNPAYGMDHVAAEPVGATRLVSAPRAVTRSSVTASSFVHPTHQTTLHVDRHRPRSSSSVSVRYHYRSSHYGWPNYSYCGPVVHHPVHVHRPVIYHYPRPVYVYPRPYCPPSSSVSFHFRF